MAIRYSGRVKVTIRRTEDDRGYACSVKDPGLATYRVVVGDPGALTVAVDAPEAYDGAARAAIAFALDDGAIVDASVALDESGILVSREKLTLASWRETGTVVL